MDEKERAENRELAKTISFGDQGLEIQNMAQATLVADTMIASGLVPEGFRSTAKIIVAAQAAKELGKPLWWGLNNLYVIHGKVGISSAAVAGLILGSGKCVLWEVASVGTFPEDDFKIIIRSKRKDFENTCLTEFSIADAKTAGLWDKGTWKQYPKTMLTWRATAFHGRLHWSDVLAGQYTDAELTDVGPPLGAPECATPPRAERRKKIESTPVFTPPPRKPAEPSEEGTTDDETEVSGSAGEEEIDIDKLYTELKAIYDEKGGDDFAAWAADALCVGDDEVATPADFTVDMIGSLTRVLAEKGI